MNDETTISLEETMTTLESIYKPTERHLHKNYLLYTPQIGKLYYIKPVVLICLWFPKVFLRNHEASYLT